MDIRGYPFQAWIWMDMDKASYLTDGYGWTALKFNWIWMDMVRPYLWIGLDGFRFIVNSDKGQGFGDVSHVYCLREFPPPVKYVH